MVNKTDKSKLKERSKITKEFYGIGQDSAIFTELNKISSECWAIFKREVMLLMIKTLISRSIGTS